MTIYDPNLSVPAEVMAAAQFVERYFKEQGIDSFEIYGLCSRDKLIKQNEAIKNISNSVKSMTEDLKKIWDL